MNFKIQQTYPSPPIGLSNFNTLTYAQHINSLVLYGQQKGQTQSAQEQPKKKIAFKAEKSSLPLNDKISVYSIPNRKWQSFQTQGKIPSPRTQFQAIYMRPCIVIYGGKTAAKLMNEVYALNCENWTWKKLFSLDGPPPAEEFQFFQISHQTAGLIVSQALWLLQLVDVKWELSANELPGSVWQKLNLQMPEKLKFCCPLSTQELLIVGEKQAIKVNLVKKQIVRKLPSLPNQIWNNIQAECEGIKKCSIFHENKKMEKMGENIISLVYIISASTVKVLKLMNNMDIISIASDKEQQSRIQLKRPIKCCEFVKQQQNSPQRFIFYLDAKGEFLSIIMQPELFSSARNTSRIIEDENTQIIARNDSCIVQQQQNEDSSVFAQSTSSRVKISSNRLINDEAQNYGHAEQQTDYLVDSRLQNRQEISVHYRNQGYDNNISRQEQFSTGENKGTNTHQILNQQRSQSNSKPKQETSRKNIYNINGSQTNLTQRGGKSEKFKHRTEQYVNRENKEQNEKSLEAQEDRNAYETTQLKITLENILYNESIKRKLLETKVDALESVIKKSQKFVLMLCKYGNEAEKQRHIERVREIRQELEANWSKQIYYRKQMEMNKMPSQISQQIQQTMNHIQY